MREILETFESFCRKFDTENACVDALFTDRWPHGFRCPVCRHPHYSTITTRRLPLYECRSCKHQTSIIAGTIMEGSSTKLTRWFQALFLLAQPAGTSAVRLAQVIQVTYKTAWLIAHKIRHAMQQADAERRLQGNVNIHRTFYGYLCFSDARQPILVAASINDQQQPLHVKIKQPEPRHVLNEKRIVTDEGVNRFIALHVSPDANTVAPRPVDHLASLNRIRAGATNWLNDTFQGIGSKHLQAYLDEYAYRLNLNLLDVPVLSNLLQWCSSTPVLIYRKLIRNKPVLPVPWIAWGGKNKWKGHHLTLWYA